MISKTKQFRSLHHKEDPIVLGNVWNVQSALAFERVGLEAIATSSAAVAHSLGFEDGENIPFEQYLFIIGRIINTVKIPLSVDLETGFGDTSEEIVSNIIRLHELGVAGINIEDSVVRNSVRTIEDAEDFREKLLQITLSLQQKGVDVFINVRCDAYLLNVPGKIAETKRRIKFYEQAAIDGIFIPCLSNEEEIKEIVASTKLPVNVLAMPALPNFKMLKNYGIKRISMGNAVNGRVYTQMENLTQKIMGEGNFSLLF